MASINGFLTMLRYAAMDGAGVMAGRVFSRLVPDQLGLTNAISAGNMGSTSATLALAGAQLASGVLFAYAVSRVGGSAGERWAAAIGAGAFDGVYEDVLQGLQLPVIGQYLGDGACKLPMLTRAAVAGYSMGAYSRKALPRVSGYSQTGGAQAQAAGVRMRGTIGMAGGIIRQP
jgi:hypothetical protein